MAEEQMTIERAIRLLHPETTAEALAEIEYYHGFSGRTACVQAVSDACEFACKIMQEYKESGIQKLIDVRENKPEKNQRVIFIEIGDGRCQVGNYHGAGKRGGHYFMSGNRIVTARWWMPPPEMPKEDS